MNGNNKITILNTVSLSLLYECGFFDGGFIIEEEMKNLIEQNRDCKGFIITDHDYRHVLDVCDDLLLIESGICRHLESFTELEMYGYVPLGTFKNN